MNPFWKGSVFTFAIIISTEVVYKLFWTLRAKQKNQPRNKNQQRQSIEDSPTNSFFKVLFFPDKTVACRDHFVSGYGCFKDRCNFSHDNTSLSTLFQCLLSCKHSLEVCVYVFTCKDLADILLKLHRQGVKIRIISDQEQLQSTGSQIWKLRKAGIPLKVNKSSYFMHHKFAVVDSHILINGSFNWTHQAITGNHENVIITKNSQVTSLFTAEFDKLWMEFSHDLAAT